MAEQQSWYEVTSDEKIMQGDFIDSCPIVVPKKDLIELLDSTDPNDRLAKHIEIKAEWSKQNIIVVSQTCDLVLGKIKNVLVCPRRPFEHITIELAKSGRNPDDYLEDMRRGYHHSEYMLQECKLDDYQKIKDWVDFSHVYTVPLSHIKSIVMKREKRLRMLSPFREDLAQAFSRFIMRIGLPDGGDIPPFVER